jgi:hypothetical protein
MSGRAKKKKKGYNRQFWGKKVTMEAFMKFLKEFVCNNNECESSSRMKKIHAFNLEIEEGENESKIW